MFPPMCPSPTKPSFVVVVVAISGSPFDRRDVVVVEFEVGGVDDWIDLIGSPEADDRAVDGPISERPGDRGRAGGDAVALRHGVEALDEREPLAELRLVERGSCLRQSSRSSSSLARSRPRWQATCLTYGTKISTT